MAGNDQDKDTLDEMGLVKSKPEDSDQDDSSDVEDISQKVTRSTDDKDDNEYRIVLTCKNDCRVAKDAPVKATISGDEKRRLTVIAKNKKYYDSTLPKAAEGCECKIEKKKNVDLLYIFIKKSEPGSWTNERH